MLFWDFFAVIMLSQIYSSYRYKRNILITWSHLELKHLRVKFLCEELNSLKFKFQWELKKKKEKKFSMELESLRLELPFRVGPLELKSHRLELQIKLHN